MYSLLRTADRGDAEHRSDAGAVQGQLGPLEATGGGEEAGAEGAEGKGETRTRVDIVLHLQSE